MLSNCQLCLSAFNGRTKTQKFCSSACSQKFWKSKRYQSFPGSVDLPTGTVGSVSEIQAALFFLKNGWDVFRALSPSSFADLVVMSRSDHSKFFSIEVRTAYVNLDGSVAFTKMKSDSGKIFCAVVHSVEPFIQLFREDGSTPISLSEL